MREKKLLEKLERMQFGQIHLITPEGTEYNFLAPNPGPKAHIFVKNWQLLDLISKKGNIGFGEAYMEGLFDTKNLAELLTYLALNIENLTQYSKLSFLNRLFLNLQNRIIRANTKKGSKKNILAHYDISNDFYSLWLDKSMTYSSAIRNNESNKLYDAQMNKYDRIINSLETSNTKILEIGSGWGGFATRACSKCNEIDTITISDKQYYYASKKLKNKANIFLQDYRDIKAKYDRIVSIEMFEAVGEKYWKNYFKKIYDSLRKDSCAMIQTITIRDSDFHHYRKTSDYIRHHVFPGGILPSKSRFAEEVSNARMKVDDIFSFGKDYSWTLKEWMKNFDKVKPQLLKMGYNKSFLRGWDFYLALSIAGFESGKTDVIQARLTN